MRKALEPSEHSAADGAVLEVGQPVGEGREGLERVHRGIVADR